MIFPADTALLNFTL